LRHEATVYPTRDLRRRISHPYCFQQKGDTQATRSDEGIAIAGYSCQAFDDNVEVVTKLQAA